MKILIFGIFAIFQVAAGDATWTRSEDSEVTICDTFDVCNIVHNHYWGINSVEKLCKCPEGNFCPTIFDPSDGMGLPVNVRTQMKFCSPVEQFKLQLPVCDENENAIKVHRMYYIDQVKNISANLMCNCQIDKPRPIYWKFQSRVGKPVKDDDELFEIIDYFQCKELSKCEENEFCGFARMDHGFLYQRCSCDIEHDCRFIVEPSEVEEDIDSEIFYSGLMYKSRCRRNEKYEDW